MPGFSYFAVFAFRQYFSPLNYASSDFNGRTQGPGGSFRSGMNPKMSVPIFILVCITTFQCLKEPFHQKKKNETVEENLNLLLIYSPSLSFCRHLLSVACVAEQRSPPPLYFISPLCLFTVSNCFFEFLNEEKPQRKNKAKAFCCLFRHHRFICLHARVGFSPV